MQVDKLAKTQMEKFDNVEVNLRIGIVAQDVPGYMSSITMGLFSDYRKVNVYIEDSNSSWQLIPDVPIVDWEKGGFALTNSPQTGDKCIVACLGGRGGNTSSNYVVIGFFNPVYYKPSSPEQATTNQSIANE